MRLHTDTPARKSFQEYLRKVKRPQGSPKTTWMQTIRQDLACIGIKLVLLNVAKTLNSRSGSRPGLKVSKTRSDNLTSRPPFLKCMWPFSLQRFLR